MKTLAIHTNEMTLRPFSGRFAYQITNNLKRRIAISVAFFLLAIASIPANAWVADRVGLSTIWIITCNDGYEHAGLYGPDGPDFSEGNKVCANHGGISVLKPGTRSQYGLSLPVDESFLSPVTVGDLFSQGQISSQDGFRLTNTFDQEVWAHTFLEFSHVPTGGNTFQGVFVIGVATLIPTNVLFSDLGSGGAVYQPDQGWEVSGTGQTGTSYTTASEFQAASSGSVSQIDIAVGYVRGVNSFYAALYTSAGGLPGTELARWNNLSSTTNFGQCCGVITISGVTGVNLTAGETYFLVLGPMNINDTSWEEWNLNSTGASDTVLYSNDGANTWNSYGQQVIGAFAITG
jgi:hypothetical protein